MTVATAKFTQAWALEMCQRMCAGIQSSTGHRRRQYYVHDADVCYPVDGVPLGRRGRGRFRKNPGGGGGGGGGIASKE